MSATSIEWATHVWNPMTGCDRVSPGCAHCYALEYAARLKGMGQAKYQNDGDPKSSGPGFGFTVHEETLFDPPRFPAGARVFVNSMSDVFHEEAPDYAIERIFYAADRQPEANFLILTKRAARMQRWTTVESMYRHGDPLPNVWLGVSIENRRFVHRADLLRETPAAVRFISAEPLLGPLVPPGETVGPHLFDDGRRGLDLYRIDWLIAGAESGLSRRRFDLDWVRDLRDSCGPNYPRDESSIPFFYKQGSAHGPGQHRELDGRTWDELPERPDGGAVRTKAELHRQEIAA